MVSLFWHLCQICEHCLPHHFFMLCQKKREKENRNEKKKSKYSYCFYTCSSALKAAELKLVSQRSNYTLTRSFRICTFRWMPHNSHSDVFSCVLKLYLCLHNCHKISRANLESLCFTLTIWPHSPSDKLTVPSHSPLVQTERGLVVHHLKQAGWNKGVAITSPHSQMPP